VFKPSGADEHPHPSFNSNFLAAPRRPYLRPLSAQRGRRIGCCSSAVNLDAFLGKGLPEKQGFKSKGSRFHSFKVSKLEKR